VKKKLLMIILATLMMTQPVYAMSLNDLKPGGASSVPKSEHTENKDIDMEEISKQVSQKKETVADTQWDITERDTTIRCDLNKGVTRFEVFYSASGSIPYIAFQTADGDLYESGKDNENIITRGNNQISGHSDLRYEVIYIISPSSTEGLKVKISLDSKTHDFMFIKSSVPNGWENFTQEYRTSPEKLILWGFHHSDNTITDLISIAENTDIKPADNTIGTSTPPEEEKDNSFLILLFVFVIAGICVMLYLNNRTKKRQEEDAQKSRIKKKNKIALRNKENRKKKLDTALDEFDDEYADDDDEDEDEDEDFFSDTPELNEEEIKMPIEKRIAFVEPEPEEPARGEKEKVAEEKERETANAHMTEKTTEQVIPRKRPSWMD